MLENIELKGLWHLPENPTQKIAGILKYEPSKQIILELIGVFTIEAEDFQKAFFNKKIDYPIIYGETSDGTYFTLFNCTRWGSYNYSCSFPLTNFTVTHLLQGYYLKNFKDAFFDYVEFGIPKLEKWIGINTHNLKVHSQADDSVVSFELGRKYMREFKYIIDENTKIKLCTGTYFRGGYETFEIRQDAYCRIYSNIPLSISAFLEKMYTFKSLVSIGVLRKLVFSDIKFFNKDLSAEISKEKEFGMYLLFAQRDNYIPKPKNHNLFNFIAIQNNFEQIIQKWYKNNSELSPIRKHFLDAISITSIFSSTDFLILAFAIEGFYFRFRTQQKKTSLNTAIPKLIKEFKHIKLIKGLNIDINQVNDSRNYYAHLLNTTVKPNTLFGEELYDLAEKLKLLLICCLLKEMGFSDEMIDKAISNSGQS